MSVSKSRVCGYISDFFFQAEDGIRDAQESRGLGDVYKRQIYEPYPTKTAANPTKLCNIAINCGIAVICTFLATNMPITDAINIAIIIKPYP